MRVTSFLACAVVTSGLVCTSAMAANPVLRIVCGGNDVGAEVLINGKFRGECPVELQVPSGTLRLRVQKSGNAGPERTFEQSVRVAPDSLKTIEVVLVAAQPTGAERVGDKSASAKTPSGDTKVTTALREAASAGDASAMLALGAYYEAGKGVPKNYEQAINWYRKAMDAGNADAAYRLSRMYQFGVGVKASTTESEALFKKAVLGGSVRALSDLYLDAQDSVKKAGVSIDQAAPILLKAANAGDVGSMIWLGYYYIYWTNPNNPGESDRWRSQATDLLTKLADAGDISSMETLGWLFDSKRDRAAADRWFRRALDGYEVAATAGDLYSMLKIATIHWGTMPGYPPYNPEKSLYWYQKASDAGSAYASKMVGLHYDAGRGVPKNPQLAMSWYEKAVQQGDAQAAGWSQATQNAENERIASAQAEQGNGLNNMMQLLQLGTVIANNYYGAKAANLAAPLAAVQTSTSNRPGPSGITRTQQIPSAGAAAPDGNSQQPVAAQRTACIFENRTNSNDYSEAVARATLQKEINGVKALTQNSVGDPARYLSDSGITCQKEATNINPEYKCVVSIKTEVKLLGPCGNSGSTTVRSK